MGEDICIQFVGPRGEYDKLFARTKSSRSSHIFGRAWAVYHQWMAALKRLYCVYKSEPTLISLKETKCRIEKTVDILLSKTISTLYDACANTMNIARDDVADIRASSTDNRLGCTTNTPHQHWEVGGNDEVPIIDNVDAPIANNEAPLTLR